MNLDDDTDGTIPHRSEMVPALLARLDGAPVGPLALRLGTCRRHKFSGWRYFALHLESAAGPSDEPVVWGLLSVGGKGVAGWIDCDYTHRLTLADGTQLDLHERGLDIALFRTLAKAIPPDGHIMVAYEGAGHAETSSAIRIRVPAVATRLGHALFEAGFCAGFKDWYFAEGGWEGPIKLQANKPRNAAHTRTAAAAMAAELRAYLDRSPSELHPDIDARCRKRARALIERLRQHPAGD